MQLYIYNPYNDPSAVEEKCCYLAKVLADSYNPIADSRVTTFEVTFPRFMLSEYNTHCMVSRNLSSSRAIPVPKLLAKAERFPFMPNFTLNQKGMQSEGTLDEEAASHVAPWWKSVHEWSVKATKKLNVYKVHKQHANRLLEPFLWCTAITTATEWNNFFALRSHHMAQPEFQTIATLMAMARQSSMPVIRDPSAMSPKRRLHLPMIREEEIGLYSVFDLKLISAGRCARVSYLRHDILKEDPMDDMRLASSLMENEPKHMSSFEHQATAMSDDKFFFKLRGFQPFRMEIPGESTKDWDYFEHVTDERIAELFPLGVQVEEVA
jgi:thymidylate synthase ThyX